MQNRGHAAQRSYQHQRRHTYWVCVRCGDRHRYRAGPLFGHLWPAALFGLLGREDDIIIKWQDIEVIGDETILVCYNDFYRVKRSRISSEAERICDLPKNIAIPVGLWYNNARKTHASAGRTGASKGIP